MRIKLLLSLFHYLVGAMLFSTEPSNDVFRLDSHVREGLSLFNNAVNRYWTSNGSMIGNLGMLERAAIEFDFISNPATRNYYLALTELNKGYISRDSEKVKKVRFYFQEAMRFAELSLKHQENSDTYRILAESGYAWVMARKLHIRPKMMVYVSEWLKNALYLDPENTAAELLQIEIELKGRNKERMEGLRIRLEKLISSEKIDDIKRFRAYLLLSRVQKKLGNKRAKQECIEKASTIFPNNPLLN